MSSRLDEYSTPLSPDSPQMPVPTLSRKDSRPTSLRLANKKYVAMPGIQVTSSPVTNTIESPKVDTITMPPTTTSDHHPMHTPHPHPHKPISSPCFVHSLLDSGMDYFKNKSHFLSDPAADALQDVEVYDDQFHDDEYDDDEVGNPLTKCLAETAVAVRDMSKQLGRTRIQSNIQNILIVTKARDNKLIKLTRQLALFLMLKRRPGATRGLTVYVDNQLRHSRRFDAEGLKRDYPELFVPFPRRASSSNSLSSDSSSSNYAEFKDDGQLRYWTSTMCKYNSHWFDFVVTLGGDGTMLFTSWLFQGIVPPVLSFALGSLGFMTNFDFTKHNSVMNSVIDNGFRVNLRMRFTCTLFRAVMNKEGKQPRAVKKGETGEILMRKVEQSGWEALEAGLPCAGGEGKAHGKDKQIMCFTTRPVETFEVLNDLVVDRGPSPYVSQLELFGDEHHMTTVQADGLTVATPTGSTAYSLSAGGSLVHPEIPAMLITPICPHTLSFRPMLLPDTMELRICVPYNSRSTAWASFDGRGRVELKQGDHIKVTASMYPFPTVCGDQTSTDWFNSISRTLKWNERERQKSFVVVEEDAPPSTRKNPHRPSVATPSPNSTEESFEEDEEEDEEDEEEEEEEEEKFDIDVIPPEEEITAKLPDIRETRKAGIGKTTRRLGRLKSKSRSPARTSSSATSGVMSPNRYATQPPLPPSRHVDFELLSSPSSSSSDSLLTDATHEGPTHYMRSASSQIMKNKMLKERDLDYDHIKTPTLGYHHHHHRAARSAVQSETRVFAVRGQDESDSATSDADS